MSLQSHTRALAPILMLTLIVVATAAALASPLPALAQFQLQ